MAMVVAVVVPAFNEEDSIVGVVKAVYPWASYVVVVDDGSQDQTAVLAQSSGAVVIKHLINRGQGAALTTGMQYALDLGAEIIINFDADGQHNVKDIEKFITPIKNGQADVVLGSRFLGQAIDLPLSRRLVLKMGIIFTRFFSGLKLTDTNNGFRAFSRQAVRDIHISQDGMAHASEIIDEIADLKIKYLEVPVTINYTKRSIRKGQKSFNAFHIVRRLIVDKFLSH